MFEKAQQTEVEEAEMTQSTIREKNGAAIN
jgi:hypothetical protein